MRVIRISIIIICQNSQPQSVSSQFNPLSAFATDFAGLLVNDGDVN